MAGRRIKEIEARGFNRNELLDEDKRWSCTLIYDPDLLVEWGKKCLETLEKAKQLPAGNDVRIHDYDPVSVCNFQCIDYGWNYRWKKYNDASFASHIYFYQLKDIFGLNQDQELDITHPTPEQELEVCKCIMENLWKEYKYHVL